MPEALCRELVELLRAQGETLGTAESCTGGMIASAITDLAGCSDVFRGGAVVYSNELKHRLLGVDDGIFRSCGAVSEECVSALLDGVADRLGCGCGIAVSGIAGPGGGLPDKPVGTVFIGVLFRGRRRIKKWAFKGSRAEVRRAASIRALEMAVAIIKDSIPS